MVTKKQKAKERKATIIFITCLFGLIALITIIVVVVQVSENKKPKEEPAEPQTCEGVVFYRDEKTNKLMYKVLAEGHCVANEQVDLGVCSYVDAYGVCYDSSNNVVRRSTLIKY